MQDQKETGEFRTKGGFIINTIIILLFILTLPIWLILLAIISPILIPIAFGVGLLVIGKKVQQLGESMTNYEKSVSATRELLEANDGVVLEPQPKPQGTPDKLLHRNGYTIEFYLREKPPVYRVLDPNMVDFGVNYETLKEAVNEAEGYIG